MNETQSKWIPTGDMTEWYGELLKEKYKDWIEENVITEEEIKKKNALS